MRRRFFLNSAEIGNLGRIKIKHGGRHEVQFHVIFLHRLAHHFRLRNFFTRKHQFDHLVVEPQGICGLAKGLGVPVGIVPAGNVFDPTAKAMHGLV